MAGSAGSGSSSGSRFGRSMWVRRIQCNCNPPRLADIRVSDSISNPGRSYYKCRHCGLFMWVPEDQIIANHEESSNLRVLREEFIDFTDKAYEFASYVYMVVRIALVMYLILLFVTLK